MEFRFDVPFPQDIGRLYPPVKTLFFGPGAKDFSKDLSLSYWEAASGKKVSRFISNLLHLVFQNAIDRWLERGWKRLPEVAKKQVSTYRRQAKKKRGRQPDPILALWAVMRFEKLRRQLSAVVDLWRVHDDQGS